MVCPPPADETILVTSPTEGENLRRQHGIESKRVMLTVARLVPRKGIDVTLRTLALIAAEYPDLVYVVAGEGPMRAELETLAQQLGVEDRVLFLGRVENLAVWYHACDLFVMPNRQMPDGEREGYGIVFAEAGFAGKPVIGGLSGGAVDAIEDGVTGLLVDPTAPTAVAGAIRQLLHDPACAKVMGEAGRERALRFSSSKAYREKFNEVLKAAGIRS
jgi:phosphatidylinositol alpha-1,6-mannosyltransferase